MRLRFVIYHWKKPFWRWYTLHENSLHYFQAHTIVVLTQLLLKVLLRSADYTGRIAKWGIIIGAFDIKYVPRTFVKGQVLADLVAKFAESPFESETEAQHMDGKSVGSITPQEPLHWKMYVDEAVNQRGIWSGASSGFT